ncbi:MAG: cytochrome P450 [Boseongicola sp. SB0677_bin_26]|nr:cytochrome P450 [Boseongicola sp. SB0665_bin_10]MYG25971.1 cytochrome P450 [Boseongicola sp. SB0677_bin_26]
MTVPRTISDLPVLDFSSVEYRSAPFPALSGWAQKWKIARSERGVELLDYELCRNAIVDRNLGTGHPKLIELLGLPEGRPLDYKRNSISFHNRGDRRRDLRRPLTRLLSEEASERFRPNIREVVTEIVDALPADRPVDLISSLCDRIPSAVYCHWVGAPLSDADFVSRTSHTVQQAHTRDPRHAPAIVEAFEALIDYVDARIADRRRTPGDDLLSDLIRTEDAGLLDADDLRNWVIKLAEANTDNSSHQIGIAIVELASRPDIWLRLGTQPEQVSRAVQEVMRYHPRTISTSREVLSATELERVVLPEGTPVFANVGATHWNADHYSAPEVFDIYRTDEPLHLNFGGGVFSCIGRFIVTVEVEETIALLAQRFPGLALEATRFAHSPMFTSVTQLLARLEPEDSRRRAVSSRYAAS